MPGLFAGEFGAASAAEPSDAFRAGDVVLGLAVAAGNLSLRHEAAHSVGPLVIHLDVIVDVAVVIRSLPSADGGALQRRQVFHRPHHFVDAVNRLLDESIAAEPHEVVPIADLPLDIVHTGRPVGGGRHRFHRSCEVSVIKGAHFADGAMVKPLVELNARCVRAPAETGLHGQPFSLRLAGARPNRADAGGIRRDGFFEKRVFARGHRRLEVLRAKTRRRRQQHHIHTRGNHFLVSVQPHEAALGRYLDPRWIAHGLRDFAQTHFDLRSVDVPHRV